MFLAPLQLSPLQLAPLQLAPLQLAPLQFAPLQLTPMQLAPLQLAPLELAPLELSFSAFVSATTSFAATSYVTNWLCFYEKYIKNITMSTSLILIQPCIDAFFG